MLRLITSRWVRLALAAAVTTAIVVAVLRLRRSPAVSGAGPRPRTVPRSVPRIAPGVAVRVETDPGTLSGAGSGRSKSWPPAPILGTPTADDLRRYAATSRVPEFFLREAVPRKPLDHALRRTLTRWGAVVCALCLLALGGQFLESAVFPKKVETEERSVIGESRACPVYGGEAEWREAGETDDACPERDGTAFYDFSQPTQPPGVDDDGSSDHAVAEGPWTPSPEPTPVTAGPAVDADCHPVAGRPRARPLSPRVTRAVNLQWARIERWLRANAPATYRTLAGPARPGTIAVAEAQMGLRLPNDLRASLLRHNGSTGRNGARGFGPMGDELMGVRQIRDTWRTLCGTDDRQGEAETGAEPDPRTERWDGRMVPFGVDGAGGHLLVDSVAHDVGESGGEGPMGFTPGGIRIRSYYALLKATADALETDGTVGAWRPVLMGRALGWRNAAGSG
ncbi:SMI1/KNR4 family protein [Streptosporangium sp. NPDC051022]|uniref:SMI1/KNR4 family protein n=1 Tax=Streptosporangium sp. NPDC051022 TaxID=3155752 RepID=UPI003448C37F